MTTPVPDEIRKAAHDATTLPLGQALQASPHELIDLAVDAVYPLIVAAGPEPVTEHAIEMSSGDMKVRNPDPEIERAYPLDEWITHNQRFGGKVWKRRIIVVDDWEEVPRA